MVTLKDIADYVGISVSATSMALRNHESIGEETRRKVWEAKEKLGYRLKSKPTGNIAFLLFDRSFEQAVYARFFQGLGDAAAKNHKHPLFLAVEGKTFVEGKLPPLLQKRGVDGIIASGLYTAEAHEKLSKLGIPIVALGVYQLGTKPWASCENDIADGMHLAVDALAKLGHRNFGLLVSTPAEREYGSRIRFGFKRALGLEGLPEGRIEEEAIQNEEAGPIREAVQRLLSGKNRPTALIVEKAHSAVYDACDGLGLRIPEDLSIISLGRSAERMRPSLACVEAAPAEIAMGAFHKLERMMEDPSTPISKEIYPMTLYPGDSIGPAPK